MRVFKIDYTIKKNNLQYKVVMLAKDKEKAEAFLRNKLNTNIRINSIGSTPDPIHLIHEDILDEIVSKSPKIKKYQQKIAKLEKDLQSQEVEIKELGKLLDEYQRNPVPTSKQLAESMKKQKVKIYVCPFCNAFETESLAGLKSHMTKIHEDKLK